MIEPETVEKLFKAIEPAPLMGWEFRLLAMQALDQLPTYNWSGVYRLEGETLVLDAYAGASTEHTRIPVGRGVCGTAVAENRNMVVDDVRSLENYLACSLETRSEIVVLIKNEDGHILGQIDIDGHQVSAFDQSDEAMLERLAKLIADRWHDA